MTTDLKVNTAGEQGIFAILEYQPSGGTKETVVPPTDNYSEQQLIEYTSRLARKVLARH